MNLLRKAKKLIRNPKGFWEDSFLNRRGGRLLKYEDKKPVAFAFRINDWKREFIKTVYPEYHWYFVPYKKKPIDIESYIKSASTKVFVIWGYNELEGTVDYAEKNNIPLYRMEDGFIRSIGLGSDHILPMSLVLDKTGKLYFDCSGESGLEKILNNYIFDDALISQASCLIDNIVANGITKYNQIEQGFFNFDPSVKKIIAIGQVESDASIKYGCDKVITNLDLVKKAKQENPNSEIYFRPHPDIVKGNRLDSGDLREIRKYSTIMSSDIQLSDALDMAEKVYVITSLVGLEAILRNIPVVVLGKPFYSGWGLTNDRSDISRRKRKLTKYELFAGAYLLYPDYFNVLERKRTSIYSCIEYLRNEKESLNDNSLLLEDRIPAFAFHVGFKWRAAISEMLPEYNITYIELHEKNETIRPEVVKGISGVIKKYPNIVFLIWGCLEPKGTVKLARELGVPIYRFEDGFIRSVGIGASETIEGGVNLPISITLDKQSIYYDCFNSSDIETLLNTYDFQANNELLLRAKKAIARIVEEKVTKYNSTISKSAESIYGKKNKKRILVLGQVETDESIKHGSKYQYKNNDLIKIAFRENPDAELIYKPHPVVLNGSKSELSNPVNVTHYCKVITDDISLPDALETIDHVYVITSSSGFEAILRNIPVTCLGSNFYSGWGLTDDRLIINRRKRKLSKEEVFAAFYILYTRYYDHEKHEFIEIEDALDLIKEKKNCEAGIEYATQARKCLKLGLYQDAISFYFQAIKFNDNFASWYAELGECQYHLERYHDAVDSYSKAIRFYNRIPEWHLSLALSKKMAGYNTYDIKSCFDTARLMTQNSRSCIYEYFKFMIEGRIAKINHVNEFAKFALYSKNKKFEELYLLYKAFWMFGETDGVQKTLNEIESLSSHISVQKFSIKAIGDILNDRYSWYRMLLEEITKKWNLSFFIKENRKVLVLDCEEKIEAVFNDYYIIRIGVPTSKRANLWICDEIYTPMYGDIFVTNPDVIFNSTVNWFDLYNNICGELSVGVINVQYFDSLLKDVHCMKPDAWMMSNYIFERIECELAIKYSQAALIKLRRNKFKSIAVNE